MRTRKNDFPNNMSPQRIQQIEKRIDFVGKETNHKDSLDVTVSKVEDHLYTSKEMLTTTEACTFLGISAGYLYKLTSSKKIPHYKPNGRLVFFNLEELKQWALKNPAISKRLSIGKESSPAL